MSNNEFTCNERKETLNDKKIELFKTWGFFKKSADELKKAIYLNDTYSKEDNNIPITFMSLDKNIYDITVNEYAILIPRITPYNAYDKRCYFESSDTSIAEVKGGVVFPKKSGRVNITVTTANNEFQDIATINISEVMINEHINSSEIYKVNLSDWSISNLGDNAKETSKGINNMLIWAKNNSYKKVIMEPGIYLIDENNTINMLSDLELDLNGSTFKLNPSSLNNIVQINIENVSNCRITNGTIEGDRGSHGISDHEFVHGIQFNSCSNVEIDNLIIKNIQGYGLSYAPGKRKNLIYIKRENIIQDSGTKSWKTINKIDIGKIGDFFSITDPFGYGGYKYLSKYVTFDIHFYDEKNELVKSYYNKKPYCKYSKPELAKYVDITFSNSEWISDKGNTDFGNSIFFITDYDYTEKINIHNCTIENCLALGCAYSAYGDGNIIESCIFKDNGGQYASYDFDAEDGWDNMSKLILKDNKFESYNSIVLCAGDSITLINNVIKGAVYIYGRCTNTRLISNNFTQDINTIASITANSDYDGEIFFEDNIIRSNFKYDDSLYPNSIRAYMIRNIMYTSGVMSKYCMDSLIMNSQNKYIQGIIKNMYIINSFNLMARWLSLNDSILNNCSIVSMNKDVAINNTLFINCKGISLYNSDSKISINNCVFINSSYFKANENDNMIFQNCKWVMDIPERIRVNIKNIVAYYEETNDLVVKSNLFSQLILNKNDYTIILKVKNKGNGQVYIVNVAEKFIIERRWNYVISYSITGKVDEVDKKYDWTSNEKYEEISFIAITNRENVLKIYVDNSLIKELNYDKNINFNFQDDIVSFSSYYNSYFEKYLVLSNSLDINEISEVIKILE